MGEIHEGAGVSRLPKKYTTMVRTRRSTTIWVHRFHAAPRRVRIPDDQAGVAEKGEIRQEEERGGEKGPTPWGPEAERREQVASDETRDAEERQGANRDPPKAHKPEHIADQ